MVGLVFVGARCAIIILFELKNNFLQVYVSMVPDSMWRARSDRSAVGPRRLAVREA